MARKGLREATAMLVVTVSLGQLAPIPKLSQEFAH